VNYPFVGHSDIYSGIFPNGTPTKSHLRRAFWVFLRREARKTPKKAGAKWHVSVFLFFLNYRKN